MKALLEHRASTDGEVDNSPSPSIARPIRDALRRELSWTHYRALLRIDDQSARQWYMHEAAIQGWTTRALERQISTLYYERLLASSDRVLVEKEAQAQIKPLQTPRDFVRDPVMLEFLGVPGTERMLEADLERALLDNLQAFLLELGWGFAFVAVFAPIAAPERNPKTPKVTKPTLVLAKKKKSTAKKNAAA